MEARIEKAVLAHAVYLFKVDEYNRVIHLGFAADEQQCLKSDTHTDRGAAYNAQVAAALRAIQAGGLPITFVTPSEYANLMNA